MNGTNRVQRRPGTAGFTLVELAVVVAILAVLAGILVPVISGTIDDAAISRADGDMKTVGNAFNAYRINTGSWPSNDPTAAVTTKNEELRNFACFYSNVHTRTNWKGPYLNQGVGTGAAMTVAGSTASGNTGLIDPWGNAYKVYWFAKNAQMGPAGGIAIVSPGRNGTVNSSLAQIAQGIAASDDVVVVVTRRL